MLDILNFVFLGLLSLIFALMALYFLWMALKDWRRYRASAGWLPVTGTIKSVSVTAMGVRNRSYRVDVAYTYRVMGRNYRGEEIAFGTQRATYTFPTRPRQTAARYPKGSQPIIYYDPANPAQAVLERRYDRANIFFGLLCLAIAIAFILVGVSDILK